MAKKMKKEKPEEKPQKEVKAVPIAKVYKKDKENCGMRVGSAGWAVFKVMTEAIKRKAEFSIDELIKKTNVFCKDAKIKFNADARIPIMLRSFQEKGLIQKIGKEEFKKVI